MSFLTLSEINQAVNGQELSSFSAEVVGVGTDTRSNLSKKVFIALRGENFDAHDFLKKAVDAGATSLIVDKVNNDVKDLQSQVSIIQVEDTLLALQDLALYWRRKNKFKVVGITGSNGKTTSKEFAASILKTKFKTSYSKGSFNNHWGVPLTLLDSPPESEVVICEMGMNHKGEIKRLCEIAEPDIVVCTTVGSSHVGELGSIEGVAEAKAEIYKYSPRAVGIYNVFNDHTLKMLQHSIENEPQRQRLTFSSFSVENPDVNLRITKMSLNELTVVGHIDGLEGQCVVEVFGRQNITNIMVAVCVAKACGMSSEEVWQALPNCKTTWGRNELYRTESGAFIIFDGYNANLESMTALLKNLYEIEVAGKKIVILGEMLELGEFTSDYHQQLGTLVGKSQFDYMWFIGPSGPSVKQGVLNSGFDVKMNITDDFSMDLAQATKSRLSEGDVVVIKGSRGMKLERVLAALT